MSVWKATSASPTESASTQMAPLPVLAPLATGPDHAELLVWVSPQAVSEHGKGGLTAGTRGRRAKGDSEFLGGLGNLHGSREAWRWQP